MDSPFFPQDQSAGIAPEGSALSRRGSTRSSMHRELLELFRPTERVASTPSPSPLEALSGQHRPSEPSLHLRRYLGVPKSPVQPIPTGIAQLDDRLHGGFTPGLHVLSGGPGVDTSAFLRSVLWHTSLQEHSVLYYTLKQEGLEVWQQLVTTLAAVLERPAISAMRLQAHMLTPTDLEALRNLDGILQQSVLSRASLIDTIPASADALGAFLKDVARKSEDAAGEGGPPLVLIDDLDRLLGLTRVQPVSHVLAVLDEHFATNSITALLAALSLEGSGHDRDFVPARTVLHLAPAEQQPDEPFVRLDLTMPSADHPGGNETIALLHDPATGFFAGPSGSGSSSSPAATA
jgi:hypothetical protein